jgi:hypothetical protein
VNDFGKQQTTITELAEYVAAAFRALWKRPARLRARMNR